MTKTRKRNSRKKRGGEKSLYERMKEKEREEEQQPDVKRFKEWEAYWDKLLNPRTGKYRGEQFYPNEEDKKQIVIAEKRCAPTSFAECAQTQYSGMPLWKQYRFTRERQFMENRRGDKKERPNTPRDPNIPVQWWEKPAGAFGSGVDAAPTTEQKPKASVKCKSPAFLTDKEKEECGKFDPPQQQKPRGQAPVKCKSPAFLTDKEKEECATFVGGRRKRKTKKRRKKTKKRRKKTKKRRRKNKRKTKKRR
jgi:hypothetical protein